MELQKFWAVRGEPPLVRQNSTVLVFFHAGARIDHAHHDSTAQKALADTVAFDEAVKKAIDLTNDEETLIVVTADHSHVFTMGGYAQRGNPILGEI